MVQLLKRKKQLKNLCKEEIQIILREMILIKLVFNMIWLMVNIKILLKEELDKVLRDKAFKVAISSKYDG